MPAYIWPNDGKGQSCSAAGPTCTTVVDPASYKYPSTLIMPGSPGTNWWKAVFGSGQYRDANLAVSGGGEDNAYHVSFNFLDQEGTAAFTRLQRGGVRINTAFNMGRTSVGENVALSRERHYGGLDDDALGEDNIIGKNIMQQPVVPVYDINGYFASGKAVGLSNLTNPLKIADAHQHDISTNDRIFGNVFAGFDAAHDLSLKTRLGFNLGQNSFHGFSPTTPENSEVTDVNGINENYNLFTEWTWSNTLNYTHTINQHNLAVLLGQEATKNTNRFEAGSCANLLNPDVDSRYIQDALCDPTTKNVTSSGGQASLLSVFGKADYNFADKYYLSFTLRRDGSSRLGPNNQWGTFPAVGAVTGNLALSVDKQGRIAEARRLYETALKASARLRGEGHPDTAVACNNLAGCLDGQALYAESETYYRQALAALRAGRPAQWCRLRPTPTARSGM